MTSSLGQQSRKTLRLIAHVCMSARIDDDDDDDDDDDYDDDDDDDDDDGDDQVLDNIGCRC